MGLKYIFVFSKTKFIIYYQSSTVEYIFGNALLPLKQTNNLYFSVKSVAHEQNKNIGARFARCFYKTKFFEKAIVEQTCT